MDAFWRVMHAITRAITIVIERDLRSGHLAGLVNFAGGLFVSACFSFLVAVDIWDVFSSGFVVNTKWVKYQSHTPNAGQLAITFIGLGVVIGYWVWCVRMIASLDGGGRHDD